MIIPKLKIRVDDGTKTKRKDKSTKLQIRVRTDHINDLIRIVPEKFRFKKVTVRTKTKKILCNYIHKVRDIKKY